jgi:hypothetical protein
MHGMHQKHMQDMKHMEEMKAQVEKMRATLEQMKVNLAKIKRPGLLEQHAQFDVDLWEAMVHHMEGMVAAMSHPPDMEMGEMHEEMGCCGSMHKGSDCCAGMKEGESGKCMKKDAAEAPPTPAN